MSKLTVVGIPIGNLEDISFRSLRYIFESRVVLAEDTRSFTRFKGLLNLRYADFVKSFKRPDRQQILSYREQNHKKMLAVVLELLSAGSEISLFSDAGMPGISDPGQFLLKAVADAGFAVDVVPGPTAATSALVLSGLPSDRFVFLGFLPKNRTKSLNLLSKYWDDSTVIKRKRANQLGQLLTVSF